MKKITRNETLVKALVTRFSKGENSIHPMDREKIDGQIIISAEDGDHINGFPVADYYDAAFMDPKEKRQRFGVNIILLDYLASVGWETVEWENAGCVVVYRD